MALDGTYSGLQASIADWLERSDLTNQIKDFIGLAEADMSIRFGIRTIETDATLTGIPGSRFIPLPAGYRETQALWIVQTGGREEVRWVLPTALVTSTTQGLPYFAAADGTNIAFERPCDQAYTFNLRMESSLTLSDAVPTNLVLQNYPQVYLYGALSMGAAGFLQDDGMLQRFLPMYTAALDAAVHKEGRDKALAPARTEVSAGMLGQRTSFDIRRGA